MTQALSILPAPQAPRLTRRLAGTDHTVAEVETSVVEERPLTIFLNSQEVVTAMAIGDYPEYLALGFLKNQGMLKPDDTVTGVDHDADAEAVVVRTTARTTVEEKVEKKIRTSGCAVGTVFGDMMEGMTLPRAKACTSWIYALGRQINTPSLYLVAGAIHGTVLCRADRPPVYMEDVGRHIPVDKIAGWILRYGDLGADKILYTTGRLTWEIMIKTALMGIPVLAARSGFHRTGGGDRPTGGADPDRSDAGGALCVPVGRAPPDPRRRPGRPARRGAPPPPQGSLR